MRPPSLDLPVAAFYPARMAAAGIIALILKALKWLILIDVILSWVMPDKHQFPRNITTQITDPLYAPVRAILKPQATGGLDLSPLAILLLVQLMESMLLRAA